MQNVLFILDDYKVKENVRQIETDLFIVKSRRDSSIAYYVDTSIGRCECPQGVNGSTCWHQFLLWSKLKKSSFNFLPVHDSEEKKKLTEIAIGCSLEPQFYDSIHSSFAKDNSNVISNSIQGNEIGTNASEAFISHSDEADSNKSCLETSKVLETFDQFYHSVVTDLQNGDGEFRKSVDKFLTRYDKFSLNQKKSALQSFGTTFIGKSRGKIKVQPTAVSRRVSKIGSRQRQSNNKTKVLPNRRITLKRKHKLSEVVDLNVPSAKKAGRSMISNTKYPKRNVMK